MAKIAISEYGDFDYSLDDPNQYPHLLIVDIPDDLIARYYASLREVDDVQAILSDAYHAALASQSQPKDWSASLSEDISEELDEDQ